MKELPFRCLSAAHERLGEGEGAVATVTIADVAGGRRLFVDGSALRKTSFRTPPHNFRPALQNKRRRDLNANHVDERNATPPT